MNRLIRRSLLPLAAAIAFSGAGLPATAAPLVELDRGHVDVVGIGYENGVLDLHVHDDESGTEYSPAQVRLVARPGARTTVAEDPAYGFLGAPGADVWVLPQVQDPELLWPGIGAEEVAAGTFAGDSLRVDVLSVCGPGDVSVFTTDAFGTPTVLVDSGNGLPDRVNTSAGAHLHANWAFEAAGDYTVQIRVSGVLASTGRRISSAVETYSFRVDR